MIEGNEQRRSLEDMLTMGVVVGVTAYVYCYCERVRVVVRTVCIGVLLCEACLENVPALHKGPSLSSLEIM